MTEHTTPALSPVPVPTGPVDLLRALGGPTPPPFAVLRRQGGPGVEVLVGDVVDVPTLADLPIPEPGTPPVLALVPFRQVTERSFACHDDGTPLRCLRVTRRVVLDPDTALAALPRDRVRLRDPGFDLDDDAYAEIVKEVIGAEIGMGEGANFVIRRDLLAGLDGPPPARAALALLRRLLLGEPGAYWTFAVHTPGITMVGATPERHVSVTGGEVVMNPISGTYRFPATGPTREDLLRFLGDPKEVEELYMVVDEELKMMSEICDRGGRVTGPYLKQMSRLAHTEYLLTGRSAVDVRDVLRATMFAATVTGSPVENACTVIARHERTGRGYYAGMAALIDRDDVGRVTLDAPILIRTAYLGGDGMVRLPVGATLVRHSVPEHEVAETRAKAAGLLAAFDLPAEQVAVPELPEPAVPEPEPSAPDPVGTLPALADLPGVAEALTVRNRTLARFWMEPQLDRPRPGLVGRRVLIVDANDAWTVMLAHMLRRLGATAVVQRWDQVPVPDVDEVDLLVAGPGPGDPRSRRDPRMAALRAVISRRLRSGLPLLAVCLSHQVLCDLAGLTVTPLPRPYQGTQRRVPAFGREVRVGFYNTFAARVPTSDVTDGLDGVRIPVPVSGAGDREAVVWADPDSGEVFAVRGAGFASTQFHLESVLSTDGLDLLVELSDSLLGAGRSALRGGVAER